MQGHAVVGVGDAGDDRIENETGIVGLEEARGDAAEPEIKPPLVGDEVVLLAPLIECQIVACDSEFEAGLLERV